MAFALKESVSRHRRSTEYIFELLLQISEKITVLQIKRI